MVIGVLTAMSSEFEQLAALLEGAEERVERGISYLVGCLGGNNIVLRQCGIGKVNAALGTLELILARMVCSLPPACRSSALPITSMPKRNRLSPPMRAKTSKKSMGQTFLSGFCP